MRVEVVVETAVRDQIVQVYVGRGASRDDAVLRATTDLEEIKRVLTANAGLPKGAICRPRGPDGSWWLYSGALWIAIETGERYDGVRPFARRVRTLAVVAAGPTVRA